MRNEDIIRQLASEINLSSDEQAKSAQYLKLFDEKDTDRSGTLCLNECAKMFGSEQDGQRFFSFMDLDQNHAVTKMEFLKAIHMNNRKIKFRQMFNDVDTDDDNKINLQELKVLLNKTGCSKKIADRVEAKFNASDRNKDGGLDFEEFTKLMCQSMH